MGTYLITYCLQDGSGRPDSPRHLPWCDDLPELCGRTPLQTALKWWLASLETVRMVPKMNIISGLERGLL